MSFHEYQRYHDLSKELWFGVQENLLWTVGGQLLTIIRSDLQEFRSIGMSEDNLIIYQTQVPVAPDERTAGIVLEFSLISNRISFAESLCTITTFLPSGRVNATLGSPLGEFDPTRVDPGSTHLLA